jgi:hypothetical protein
MFFNQEIFIQSKQLVLSASIRVSLNQMTTDL